MTHNLSFHYHADMKTDGLALTLGLAFGLGLGLVLASAKVEVLQNFYIYLY